MKKFFMERPSVATTCSNTPSRTAARGGNKKYARDRGDEGGRFLRARVPRVSIQLYAPPRPPGAFSAGDAPFPAAAAVVVVVVVSAPPTPNTTSSSSIRARLSTSFCLSVKNFPFRSASKALSAASCPAVSACPRSRALAARSNAFLGVGGDNSNRAVGTFYEGAVVSHYTTDATDAAVQANIVAAGYGK